MSTEITTAFAEEKKKEFTQKLSEALRCSEYSLRDEKLLTNGILIFSYSIMPGIMERITLDDLKDTGLEYIDNSNEYHVKHTDDNKESLIKLAESLDIELVDFESYFVRNIPALRSIKLRYVFK